MNAVKNGSVQNGRTDVVSPTSVEVNNEERGADGHRLSMIDTPDRFVQLKLGLSLQLLRLRFGKQKTEEGGRKIGPRRGSWLVSQWSVSK